jgi:UDP-2,3-diacylglucosamine hydrolase
MINYFISDLHLEETRPDIAAIFLNFLANEARRADALYILGDFFEAWIGDDDLSAFNMTIMQALRAANASGLAIYFMRGNRDFLLGKNFLNASGCFLLPDEYVLNLGEYPTLLMHGDTLCTADKAYLKFRKKSHNWLMQKLFLLKPLKTRKNIVANMRVKSKAYTSTAADYLMDVAQSDVERVMKKHQVQQLIHGHTHRPETHHFELEGLPVSRIVLAPWHERGCVLICDDKGNRDIKILTA